MDVIKTGQLHVIKNPGKNILCANCDEKDSCKELMQISMPIKYQKKILGVIQLVCTREEQKQKLLEKEKDYLKFIKEIAGNITEKLHEVDDQENTKRRIDLFHQIIDDVGKIVVVLNEDREVVHINKLARDVLKIEEGEKVSIKKSHESLVNEDIFTIQTDQKDVEVIGKIKSANSVYYENMMIIICSRVKNLKDRAYNLATGHNFIDMDYIIGSNKQIRQLKDSIKKIAKSNSTVLISGESGTGKELIARSIHSQSDRATKPFIAVNCAAIPDSLLDKVVQLDVRVVAATNKNLKQLMEENKFREDLYYRLNVIPITVPPLRKRLDDIEKLSYHFLKRYNESFAKNVTKIDDDVLQIFMEYDWNGNIRELENVIEYMMNVTENDTLTLESLPSNMLEKKSDKVVNLEVDELSQRVVPLSELEKNEIKKALDIYGYDTKGKKMAARKLGIGIATLYRKIEHMAYQ